MFLASAGPILRAVSDENKAVVARFSHEFFTRGRLEVADDYLTRDFRDHNPLLGFAGDREGLKATAAAFRRAFPDWRSVSHDLIAEGDRVVEPFAATGTHRGELLEISATGRSVSVEGVSIYLLRGGRIAERWGLLDQAGLLRQLGISAIADPAVRQRLDVVT